MAQGFARMEQQISAENQAVRADLVKHYSQLDRKIDAQAEHYQQSHNQLLSSMDSAARSYEEYWRDKKLSDNMLRELREEVEKLKKHDMEKAAAIEKIENQIKAA
jgi:predicted RNase H-like nuclease (RuvC/YqgF family)